MKKKLVFDVRMINSSGIGTYIKNFIPSLISRFNVTLIGDKIQIEKIVKDSDCEIIHCNLPIYSVVEQLKLPFLIPICDVFLSPHYNVSLLPIKANKRLTFIADVYHLAHYNELSFIQKIYAKVFTASAVFVSDKIITISYFSEKEIVKFTRANENKIEVIHLGTDRLLYRKLSNTYLFEQVKAKYELPERFMLFVGNVKPHKNLKRLLKALLTIYTSLGDIKLVIVGKKEGFITGDLGIFDLLDANPAMNKKVIFTGYVENDDIPILYNMADFFVFPSIYEGFGLPPLEAMSCGCPTVVSNAASIPEICGDASLYFNPYDIASIASAIETMIIDQEFKQELIQGGYKNLERFDWNVASEKLSYIIENV